MQGEDVRGAAVEDEERACAVAEVLAQAGLGRRGVGVVAVRGDVAGVGRGDGGEDVGVGAGEVVAGEAAGVLAHAGSDIRLWRLDQIAPSGRASTGSSLPCSEV